MADDATLTPTTGIPSSPSDTLSDTPLIYEFFYVWADEVGDCCGPGTESVQAAISMTEVRLLCLCCKQTRVGRSHSTRIVI